MIKFKDKHLLIAFLLLFGLFLLSMFLFGCSVSVPVINAKIKAVPYLNPDVNNRASPVVLTFFQLSNPTAFNNASFFALDGNASETLGSTLIDKATYEIQPEQKITVSIPLAPKTYFVGAIAAYRDLENAKWREVFPVFPDKGRQKIDISLLSQRIVVNN